MRVNDIMWSAFIACVVAGIVVLRYDNPAATWHWRQGVWLFVVRALALCWMLTTIAVLFKIRTVWLPKPAGNPFATINLVPFKTIGAAIATRRWIQIIGNIAIFVPLPVLLRANFPTLTRRTQWWIVYGMTAVIEPIQLLINILVHRPFNVVDIDDVLLNLLGCLIGIGLRTLVYRS